jgi:hypothetical protein
MKRWVKLAALLCVVLFARGSWAQPQEAPWAPGGESRPEDLHIHLFTFGPGDEIISWWGHTALVVEDRRLNHARLYNYGMFSFGSDMLPKFAKGRLEFWVGEAPVIATVRMYAHDKRSVHSQELNLDPEARVQTAQRLALNVRPENRTYLYDHYRDNCSSRPRDVIDAAVGGQLRQATSAPGRMTLRQHTQRYTQVSPPMSVFLDFMMNSDIDQPISMSAEAFLPDELERQVDALQYTDSQGRTVPLVARKQVLANTTRAPVPELPPRYEPALLGIGLTVGALFLASAWGARKGSKGLRTLHGGLQALVGLVLGIPGAVLVVMWAFTNHTVTYHNENLFLANPLTLLLIPWGIKQALGNAKAAHRAARLWYVLLGLGCLAFALKLLPGLHQDNGRALALLFPVLLFGAAAALVQVRGLSTGEETHGGGREGAGVGTSSAA